MKQTLFYKRTNVSKIIKQSIFPSKNPSPSLMKGIIFRRRPTLPRLPYCKSGYVPSGNSIDRSTALHLPLIREIDGWSDNSQENYF